MGSPSDTGSAWSQRAWPAPMTPVPTRARCTARITSAGVPLGRVPDGLDAGDHADVGVAAVEAGDQQKVTVVARGVGGVAGLVGLEGDGEHHLGQHDARGERQNGKGQGVEIVHAEASSKGPGRKMITRLPAC